MIRVLVADDSPTARSLLVSILSADPEIRVVGEASDGHEAVERTRQLRPDLVTMDLRMPGLDGFQATKEIMIVAPTPIIIVTASVAVDAVETSLDSLRAGALAVLAKPAGPQSPLFETMAQQLVANVKALSQVKVVRHWRPMTPRSQSVSAKLRGVAIATSTGGPAALHDILGQLPGDFPAPILVVQHISRGFAVGLAEWLNKESPLHVKVAAHGEPLLPRTVYLAADDHHLGVSTPSAGFRVELTRTPAVGGFRPSATALFESAAAAFGAGTTAVILTGMGNDGVAGLAAVRRAGGRILAQDEKSSVVFGMPGSAIAEGIVDQVLPLSAIAARLVDSAQG